MKTLKHYLDIINEEFDLGDIDDYLDKLEIKNPEFVRYGLKDPEEFVEMHKSKNFKWLFKIYDTENSYDIKKMNDNIKKQKSNGWEVYNKEDNMDQHAVIFYKRK